MMFALCALFESKSVAAQSGDIIDLVSGSAEYTSLVAAFKTANLLGTLKGNGPYTLFAPTNEAFSRLPGGTMDLLLKPESNPALTKMLIYHVVSGRLDAAAIVKSINGGGGKALLPTISGSKLVATLEDGKVKLTDENGRSAYLTGTDMKASNGIIHVIDGVMLPK